MVPDSPSLNRKTTDPLNSSIRSDVATTLMRPENKLEYEATTEDTLIQEQNKTIDMSDFVDKEPLMFSPDPVEQDEQVQQFQQYHFVEEQNVIEEPLAYVETAVIQEQEQLPEFNIKKSQPEPEISFSISSATLALLAEENA